ncbi:MAG: hypothetical protein LBI31_06325 [Zoogloeaceae bacterium]|jgi:hypothetical protein|nr:hypothetical protein [Zoogloeaceae bacterium]
MLRRSAKAVKTTVTRADVEAFWSEIGLWEPNSAVITCPEQPIKGYALESDYALTQLELLAWHTQSQEFVLMMESVFGEDIPARTYLKLRGALRAKQVRNPRHVLVEKTKNGKVACYDNNTREIYITARLVDRASKGVEAAWELFSVLLHEFGHHVDNVLRSDLAEKDASGKSTVAADAPHEEGRTFAYQLAFLDIREQDVTEYAHYVSPGYSGALKVDHAEARRHVLATQGDGKSVVAGMDKVEYFSAGRGDHADNPCSFGHESIEDVLDKADFDPDERKQIYFGNWLRDYSQLLTPAMLSPLEGKNLGRGIGRKAWTNLVDMLAMGEFYDWRKKNRENFEVTPERLGVYRPQEHIDNPVSESKWPENPKDIDPLFEPWVREGDGLLEIDKKTGMKAYIQMSVKYMEGEFDKAIKAGRTPEGMIHFGAGLHVLEDLFAHSNFVELCLRKRNCAGCEKVLVWTALRSLDECEHKYPIVTGSFGFLDMVASLGPVMEKLFFQLEKGMCHEDELGLSTAQRIFLLLLKELLSPEFHETAEAWLMLPKKSERMKCERIPGYDIIQGILAFVINLPRQAGAAILSVSVNAIGGVQVSQLGDPNVNPQIDPTHTQLSKDHDDHPLHTLAVLLAKHAVKDVGMAMANLWNNDMSAQPIDVAKKYFCHPFANESTWLDEIDNLIEDWVNDNKEKIEKASNIDTLKNMSDARDRVAKEILERWLRIFHYLAYLHKNGKNFASLYEEDYPGIEDLVAKYGVVEDTA